MIPFGFRGVLAPNIAQPNIYSADTMRKIVRSHGRQVATHAYTNSEHTNISGDTLRAQFMRSRHLQNAIGVTGGDDVAWRGGLETSYANMKIVNSFFRSGGTTSQRAV